MASTNKPWSDRPPPPPLPSYPPAATGPDEPESGRWFLVSLAGRASIRVRDQIVVGSSPNCDLTLAERGIAPRQALLSVEAGDLYITSLSDVSTLVDGKALHGRMRLDANAALSFGEVEVGVLLEQADSPAFWNQARHRAAVETLSSLPPSPEPATIKTSPRDAPPGTSPRDAPVSASPRDAPPGALSRDASQTPRLRQKRAHSGLNAAQISLGIALSLVLVALWIVGADQWPARFAEDPSPAQVAAPSRSPLEADEQSRISDQPKQVAGNEAPKVASVPIAAEAFDVAPQPTTSPADATEPQPLEHAIVDSSASTAPGMPAPDVAEAPPEFAALATETAADSVAPTETAPVTTETDAGAIAEVPAMPAPATAQWTAETAQQIEHGPLLVYPQAEPPLSVAVRELATVGAPVEPPRYDGPPVAPGRFDLGPPLKALTDVGPFEGPDAGVKPPWSDQPSADITAVSSSTPANASVLSVLMAEADRRYSQGDLVTPPNENAAKLYVEALQIAPKAGVARARLNNIVGWIALDASDMLADRRVDSARRTLAQLSAAVPRDRRSTVDASALRRWRVVEMLLSADALMRKRQIVGPAKPNAVAVLREVLRIDHKNAVAEEMLARALSRVVAEERGQVGDTRRFEASASDR